METTEPTVKVKKSKKPKDLDQGQADGPSSAETAVMVAYGAAERLRADIQAVRPAILEGTVVKFVSQSTPATQPYTYVALFVGAQWYLTGTDRSPFPRTMNHVDFLALLGRPTIHSIETAITWEGVA